MQLNLDFNHHSKCEKIQLTDLMFANDVLFFSRGDYISIELLLKAFHMCLNSTGMKINHSKSKIYFGFVDYDTKNWILNMSSFKEGALLFDILESP